MEPSTPTLQCRKAPESFTWDVIPGTNGPYIDDFKLNIFYFGNPYSKAVFAVLEGKCSKTIIVLFCCVNVSTR